MGKLYEWRKKGKENGKLTVQSTAVNDRHGAKWLIVFQLTALSIGQGRIIFQDGRFSTVLGPYAGGGMGVATDFPRLGSSMF